MKYYCRYCYSYNIYQFWHKQKLEDWGLCRSCRKTAPLHKFYKDYDSGFYDHIDDRIKEIKNERS
jgi:hypothetical protein